MYARVRLFVRILVKATAPVLVLLFEARKARRSWIGTVSSDLAWLANQSNDLKNLREATIAAWAIAFRGSARNMLKSIRIACGEASQRLVQAELEVEISLPLQRCLSGEFVCSECGDQLGSKQALAVHAAKKHGFRRGARSRISGSTCPVCLRVFASRSRCLDHLHEKSQLCLVNVLVRLASLPIDLFEAVEAEGKELEMKARKAGERHTYSSVLAKQAEGPLRRLLIPFDHSRQSRFKLLGVYLRDASSTFEVDYNATLQLVDGLVGDGPSGSSDDENEVSLEVLRPKWMARAALERFTEDERASGGDSRDALACLKSSSSCTAEPAEMVE